MTEWLWWFLREWALYLGLGGLGYVLAAVLAPRAAAHAAWLWRERRAAWKPALVGALGFVLAWATLAVCQEGWRLYTQHQQLVAFIGGVIARDEAQQRAAQQQAARPAPEGMSPAPPDPAPPAK